MAKITLYSYFPFCMKGKPYDEDNAIDPSSNHIWAKELGKWYDSTIHDLNTEDRMYTEDELDIHQIEEVFPVEEAGKRILVAFRDTFIDRKRDLFAPYKAYMGDGDEDVTIQVSEGKLTCSICKKVITTKTAWFDDLNDGIENVMCNACVRVIPLSKLI